MPGSKEYKAQWAKENREKVRAAAKRYATSEHGKAKRLAQTKKWQVENKDKVKDLKKKYYESNKEHHLEVKKVRRAATKEETAAYMKAWRAEQREWYKEFKKSLKCSRCPESRSVCLDFHHTDPATKEHGIAFLVKYGKDAILKEFAKCIVLCANCHRMEHAKMEEENAQEL